jgi:hypothetical protein
MANDSRFSLSGDYATTSKMNELLSNYQQKGDYATTSKMNELLSNYQQKGDYAKKSDLTPFINKDVNNLTYYPTLTNLNEILVKDYQPRGNYLKYTDNKTLLDLEHDYINIRSKDKNYIASLGKNESQFYTNVFMNEGINIGNIDEYVSFKKVNNCLNMTYVKKDKNINNNSETLLNSWCQSNFVSNVSNINNSFIPPLPPITNNTSVSPTPPITNNTNVSPTPPIINNTSFEKVREYLKSLNYEIFGSSSDNVNLTNITSSYLNNSIEYTRQINEQYSNLNIIKPINNYIIFINIDISNLKQKLLNDKENIEYIRNYPLIFIFGGSSDNDSEFKISTSDNINDLNLESSGSISQNVFIQSYGQNIDGKYYFYRNNNNGTKMYSKYNTYAFFEKYGTLYHIFGLRYDDIINCKKYITFYIKGNKSQFILYDIGYVKL